MPLPDDQPAPHVERVLYETSTDAAGRRWTYDHEYGSRYVYLVEHSRKGDSARQVEVAAGVVIDYDDHDHIIGIEFI